MLESLLHNELGLWATAANLPSFGPRVGILLTDMRNKAVDALAQGVAIESPALREDIRKWITALDLVCGVALVHQEQAIKNLERILEREGHTNAESDSTGNDPA